MRSFIQSPVIFSGLATRNKLCVKKAETINGPVGNGVFANEVLVIFPTTQPKAIINLP